MSISDRIKLLLRSEFNALKSSSNREIRHAVDELENEFSVLRGDEEKLIGSIRQRREEGEMWEERARLALNMKNDAMAKYALMEQNRVLAEIKRLKQDLQQIQSSLQEIGTGIRRLRRTGSLEGESRTTDTSINTHPSRPHKQHRNPLFQDSSSFQDSFSSFQAFDQVAESMERHDATLQAEQELYSGFSFSPNPDPILDPEGVAFEDEYRRIIKEKKLNDDLADLKSKFES